MKYSEKMSLLLKGVKMDEIKALEAEELQEIEELKKLEEEKDKKDPEEKDKKDPEEDHSKLLLEAQNIIKDLEAKLDEYKEKNEKLTSEIAEKNNKKTVADQSSTYDAGEVFKELFNKSKGGKE